MEYAQCLKFCCLGGRQFLILRGNSLEEGRVPIVYSHQDYGVMVKLTFLRNVMENFTIVCGKLFFI